NRSTAERVPAMQLLAFLGWREVQPALLGALAPNEPNDVRHAALRVLGTFDEADVAAALLQRWRELAPALREEGVTVLLSRPIWHEPLMAALEKGDIPISQISIPQRGRLAAMKDEK